MLAMLHVHVHVHVTKWRILVKLFSRIFSYSGFIIAAFVFNDSLDMGVKGVLTAVSNVNNSLLEIQSKVTELTAVGLSISRYLSQ